VIKKIKNIIISTLATIALTIAFWGGYLFYPVQNPCQVIHTGTKYIHDTTEHNIYHIYPVLQDPDTVVYRDTIPGKIDTAEVVRDYYAKHFYTRHFTDSLLDARLTDIITQNRPTESRFTYKILKPQTIINNTVTSTTWNRYLCIGLDANIYDPKFSNVELIYASPKFYAGAGYMPLIKGFNIKAGLTIIKLKKTIN
jgi:hypothetical protein